MVELAPNNPYGLALRSPIIAAAGCFGYGVEYARMIPDGTFGAIVTRTTTLRPLRAPRPQLLETPAGMLGIGTWSNPGIERVIDRYAALWTSMATPVILSIAGDTAQEYNQIAGAIEGVEGISALELALPSDSGRAVAAIAAARKATPLPLLAKLPMPSTDAPGALAEALISAGADALTLFAPPRGLHVAPNGEQHTGFLYGPAVRPLVLRQLAELAPQLGVPIIGCGGVTTAEEVRQYLAVGARAVQVGTLLLTNPHAAATLATALTEL